MGNPIAARSTSKRCFWAVWHNGRLAPRVKGVNLTPRASSTGAQRRTYGYKDLRAEGIISLPCTYFLLHKSPGVRQIPHKSPGVRQIPHCHTLWRTGAKYIHGFINRGVFSCCTSTCVYWALATIVRDVVLSLLFL